MNRKLDIIATLGPSLFTKEEIMAVQSRGATILRINGAHNSPAFIDKTIQKIRSYDLGIKIMVDLPGNKIRTKDVENPIKLEKNKVFTLEACQINYPHFFDLIAPGTRITAHDSQYTFEVVRVTSEALELRSYVDGILETNKGLHVGNVQNEFDFIFEKDLQILEVALKNNIDYLAVSFVRTAEDILSIKKIIGDHPIRLISKIETEMAVKNIEEILDEVDHILIDRGDLSSSVGLLNIVQNEEKIIDRAHMREGLKIFIATQFLTNMIHSPVPSLAEVFSLYRALSAGIDGIQLSEETAIGQYGPQCVDVIRETHRKVYLNGAYYKKDEPIIEGVEVS